MNNLKTLILAGVLAIGPAAFATHLVNFEDLNNNGTSGYTLYGPSVQSGGYQFDSVFPNGSGAELASWTADIGAPYTGSVALFANYNNDEVMMTQIGGGLFNVVSIDVADVFRSAGNSLTILLEGTHADNSTTTVQFNMTDSSNLMTYAVGLSAVKSVRIYDGNDSSQGLNWFQFDNISTVPEPASMIALGVGALALLRRRRAAK
ncbi:MAG: PEP-CTERM sorting domain-containing protein [Fimbriimonadaceae bacterium]